MCPLRKWRPVCLLLLGAALPTPNARGQSTTPPASGSGPGFETFVVTRQAAPAPRSSAFACVPAVPPVCSIADTGCPGSTDMSGDAVLTLFPGISGLETGLSGRWQGHALDARLHPGDWLWHGVANDPGFVQMSREPLCAGADADGQGSGRGLRLLSPLPGGGVSVGLGLYRADGPRSQPLVPGVDGFWQTGRTRISAQAGLDSSWRVQSRTRGGWLETESFAARAGDGGAMQCGTTFSARLSGASTLFQRVVYRPDRRQVALWAWGGVQRVGGGLLSLDSQTSPLAGRTLHQTTVAFSLPLPRQFLSLGLQQSVFGTQRQQQVEVMTQKPFSPTVTGWLGEGLAWQRGAGPRSVLTLGASLTPTGPWSARAECTQSKVFGSKVFGHDAAGSFQWRGSLGCQCSQNLQVRVLYGPSFQGGRNNAFEPVWGLQITRRFQVRGTPPTGSIEGRVLRDGQPSAQPLAVALDGEDVIRTDTQGRFAFRHVAPGHHSVGLALASLPANLNPAEAACPVDVEGQHCAPVLLRVGHVGEVTGHLDIGPDEFGATDPTAAIGVTVRDEAGHATTTDADGNFVLGNMTPGSHVIALVADTLPPRYAVSPARQSAEIVVGSPSPMLSFMAAPERRPVQFVAPASSSANAAVAPAIPHYDAAFTTFSCPARTLPDPAGSGR